MTKPPPTGGERRTPGSGGLPSAPRLPRRSDLQPGVARWSAAWTGRSESVRVTSQRFPRVRASGRTILESWGGQTASFALLQQLG
jgi:hypothetical protein